MLLNCGVGEDSCESLGVKGIQPVHPKGDQSLSVHWKDWCWSWNSNTLATWCEELTHLKRPWCWERGQEEKGMTEDEMVEWHHWLDRHGFRWTPGVSDGQGGLACCSSWGCKESDMTEWLNWTDWISHLFLSLINIQGNPGIFSVKEPAWQCRIHKRLWFDP